MFLNIDHLRFLLVHLFPRLLITELMGEVDRLVHGNLLTGCVQIISLVGIVGVLAYRVHLTLGTHLLSLLHVRDLVSLLFDLVILAVRRASVHSRVVIRIPIFGLPISSDKASRLFKVCRFVEMFLASLDFGFHAATGLTPFAQVCGSLLVPPLISQLLVLVVPPYLLELLLFDLGGRIIRKEAGSAFEFVDRRVLDLLVTIGVEALKLRFVCGAFGLRERARCL